MLCAQAVDESAERVYPRYMARVAKHTVPITARLTPDVVKAVQRIADREERTVSQVMLRLIRERLQAAGELPPDEVASVASASPKTQNPAE